MTPTELWLPIGAVGFYLYDSASLLWQNELVFEQAGSRWRVAGGSSLRLMGRRLALPNPLTPAHARFHVRWSPDDPRPALQDSAALQQQQQLLRGVGWLVNSMMVLLLFAVPLVSWLLGAGLVLLAIFAAYYLGIIAALTIVYRQRHALHVEGRKFWSLAFDVLACAPFAVNLIRKLALRSGIAGNPLLFAARNFDQPARAAAAALVRARLEEQHVLVEPSPQERQLANAMLAQLVEGAS